MYLFSGEATCLKVIPALEVMSVNAIFPCGGVAGGEGKKAVTTKIKSKRYFKMTFVGAALRGRPGIFPRKSKLPMGGAATEGRPLQLIFRAGFFF